MKFLSPDLDEMMEREAQRRRWVVDATPAQVAALAAGQTVVRGEIIGLVGPPAATPVGLPFLEGAPQRDQLAAGQTSVQSMQHGRTCQPEFYKMCRPFLLRDATGHVLVRFDERDREDLDLFLYGDCRLYGPSADGIFIPCALLGDEVVVAGTARSAANAGLSHREALPAGVEPPPMVIDAAAIYDVLSWASMMRHR